MFCLVCLDKQNDIERKRIVKSTMVVQVWSILAKQNYIHIAALALGPSGDRSCSFQLGRAVSRLFKRKSPQDYPLSPLGSSSWAERLHGSPI